MNKNILQTNRAPAEYATHLVVVQVLGALILCFCLMLIAPVIVALIYDDGLLNMYLWQLGVGIPAGGFMLAWSIRRSVRLRLRDGFVIVALLWFTLSLLGSLPLYFGAHLSYSEAVFESASGITTTGATVIIGLDRLPRSLLFFRQELQWFGGIGVIVSAIALLPMLGLGGMQMMKAETPGPVKGAKLTPRIMHTARALWRIYLVMTIACLLCYWAAGMEFYDAVAHSFSTVSTGGFSTHDASLGYYDKPLIEMIAVVFMLFGAMNFSVHFAAWSRRSPGAYLESEEIRTFLVFIAVIVLITSSVLLYTETVGTIHEGVRESLFTVVSVITSTGFTTEDFSAWPLMLPVLMIFISFVGGCAGSTAGGMKVIRFLVMARQAQVEVNRLIHPNLVRTMQIDGRTVPDDVIRAVWAFFATYVVVFAVLMMVLMGQGMDQVSAFGAVATCLNNLGPGLGDVATTFASTNAFEQWVLVLAMIAGRLEIFTILVLMTPTFWSS